MTDPRQPMEAESRPALAGERLLALEAVLCTEELSRRPARAPDYETESRALVASARALADSPRFILQTLADIVLELLSAHSAGVSLLSKDERSFLWPAIAGAWQPHIGRGTPRDFGPCGDVLDRKAPLLFKRFERRYPYLLATTPHAEECLLVPFYVEGKAVGTIWAIAHDDRRKFDAEDLRQLENMGRFAAAAYQAVETLGAFEQCRAALSLLEDAVRSRQVMERINEELRAGEVRYRSLFDSMAVIFKDITQRKLAEDALRETEAFNRSIVESSPDCIKVLDLEGNLLSMESGQELLGIEDLRPFLNTSWIDFWKGEDRAAACAAIAAAQAGTTGKFVGFFRTLRGEPKWWDVAISPILDATRKPARLLAVSRDVTARKEVEDVIHRRTAQFATLLDAAPIGVYLVDADFRVREVNPSALPSFGNIPDLIGRDLGDVMHLLWPKAKADEIVQRFRHTLATGEPHVVPEMIEERIDREGTEYYEWQINRIPLPDGGHGVVCYFRDISERVQAAQKIRESEERYRDLFNSIDEGFCVIEMIFDEHDKPVDWRFLEVNPSFEKQTGIHAIVGKRMRELAPEHEEYWFEIYGKVVLTGEPVRFVSEAKALDSRWFDLYAFQLGGRDSLKVAVIFTNITERKQSELRLQEQAIALADLDRRKDEFLAMLSHELRNPLAPLANAVQLLRLQKNEEPLQQQARNIIERQVGRLKHLVDDLLEISRVTTGRVQLRRERIDVRGIVDRAVETAHPLILHHRHELTVSLPPQPIWLHADAARLEQVVVNLLNNAAKYTDDGGQSGLTVMEAGAVAVLRVRDTGIGIAPELLPRIFDLFTQAERSLDRSQGGLGIGLCLVQRLVDLHGGNVEAQSVLGHGSEFVVSLPVMLTSLPPSPSPSIETAQPPGQGCAVLVVDDNVDAAQSLAMLLSAFGHDVRMAHDGLSALEAALDYRPDIMLLDIGLPGLSGLEVAKRIRQLPALANIVLVAMTGYGQETDRQRSQHAGFDHHLVKPADFGKLQKILATVTEKATVTSVE